MTPKKDFEEIRKTMGDKSAIEFVKASGRKVSTSKKKLAKKMKSYIQRLEEHKAEGASFDNGTWRPKRKGQTFIEAIEEHKSKHEFN